MELNARIVLGQADEATLISNLEAQGCSVTKRDDGILDIGLPKVTLPPTDYTWDSFIDQVEANCEIVPKFPHLERIQDPQLKAVIARNLEALRNDFAVAQGQFWANMTLDLEKHNLQDAFMTAFTKAQL
jgi:hypothetical protein